VRGTDDPGTAAANDATITLVTAAPRMTAPARRSLVSGHYQQDPGHPLTASIARDREAPPAGCGAKLRSRQRG
jgi:hypothetical protein